MNYLNVALLLMLSFSLPAVNASERTPAAERRNSTVEELIKQALESRQRGDFEGALKFLREAQSIEPKNADVNFYTGLTLYNLGKFDESESTLRGVLVDAPLYVDAKVILGRVLIAQGKLPESERLLREAIAQAPDYMDAYDGLASNLLAQKKTDEAIFILDLGLARKPEEAILLTKKAKIYFIGKKYSKALEVARILTSITDIYGRYQGHILIAKISFEENPMQIELAVPDLEEAIDLAPSEAEAYLVLADVYTSMWKFEKAKTLLEQALDEVKDRAIIEKKIVDVDAVAKGVLNFSVTTTAAQWNFKDGRAPWREFYLDAVWRIDPYKTLVFGFEKFSRGGVNDESVRVEYIEKVSKWVYIYASAKVTADPDFREKSAFKLGTNFITNPLSIGSTVIVAEGETRNYDTGKIYFITGGIDQYIGESLIINARVFRVLSDTGPDFNVWSVKTSWQLTPRLSVSGSYGTNTEDVGGRLARGNSAGVGAQYRLNDRVSVTGNYTRVNTDTYRANQVSVGLKVSLGGRRTTPPRQDYRPMPEYRPAPEPRQEPRPEVRPTGSKREEVKTPPAKPAPVPTPAPVTPPKKKKRFFFF
ncbi:MAG: tetratricopeptide repeat protein [Bdellovibrionota bacterium]